MSSGSADIDILPIVEGHGEVQAIRFLLQRIWTEVVEENFANVLQPIRRPKSQLVPDRDLPNALELASRKLRQVRQPGVDRRQLILLLIDADEELACEVAPKMVSFAAQHVADMPFSCVLANPEYETWFVGASESLEQFLRLPSTLPDEPETKRLGKGWIQSRWNASGSYSETLDQPRLSAKMDLALCRRRCPSFDKLCREMERFRVHS